jgi:uncharacterized protein YndB with AHSA1/START domain
MRMATVEAEAARPVRVRMSVNKQVGAVWQALVSADGTATWLGPGAVLGDKGQSYACSDGSAGVVRSFHPLEQLRLSWHARPDAPATLVEVDVTPEGTGTQLRLWHEGLSADEAPMMQRRWEERLHALTDSLGS